MQTQTIELRKKPEELKGYLQCSILYHSQIENYETNYTGEQNANAVIPVGSWNHLPPIKAANLYRDIEVIEKI